MANNTEEKRRTPAHDIHSLILNRWSPRSMTGEELIDEVLMSLFEAARWAPSSYNNQEREYPNDRKPLEEIVMEGLFHPKV
jgi:nitroreductase